MGAACTASTVVTNRNEVIRPPRPLTATYIERKSTSLIHRVQDIRQRDVVTGRSRGSRALRDPCPLVVQAGVVDDRVEARTLLQEYTVAACPTAYKGWKKSMVRNCCNLHSSRNAVMHQ